MFERFFSKTSGTRAENPVERRVNQERWLRQPEQRSFAAMMTRLPREEADRLILQSYIEARDLGTIPPATPEELYRGFGALINGAGVAYGRGGQSVEDYEETVRQFVGRYRVVVSHLGETERYRIDTFDDRP